MRDALRGFLAGSAGQALDDRKIDREFVEEMTLVLDSLLAEHIRLRERIEDLEQIIRQGLAAEPGHSTNTAESRPEPVAEAQ